MQKVLSQEEIDSMIRGRAWRWSGSPSPAAVPVAQAWDV
jgi:hypothetical protein